MTIKIQLHTVFCITIAVAFILWSPAPVFAQNGIAPPGYIVGNPSASNAFPSPSSLTSLLDRAFCNTANGVLVRGASVWACNPLPVGSLSTGAADSVLGNFTAGTAAPAYLAIGNCTNALTYSTSSHTFGCNVAVGTGTVTSVGSGTGLTGGPITSSGSLALAAIAADYVLGNFTGGSAAPTGGALTSCSTGSSALTYNTSTHAFGCNSSLGAGTVTSIVAGTGLSGGTITSTGTVALAAIAADNLLGNFTGGSAAPTAGAIGNCSNALTYSTSTHSFGCNTIAGTGTVTSVATGTGLTGGPVTSTGTVALASIAADNLLGNFTGGSTAPIAGALTSCSGGTNALTYNTSTHAFGCNTITGATPAGSTGYIQFNTSSAFNADANLFWDNTNKRLGVGTISPTASVHINKALPSPATVLSNSFLVANGAMSATSGNDYPLGGFQTVNTNTITLNARAHQNTNSSGFTNVALGISYDVDSTVGVGGQIWLYGGNVGIGTPAPTAQLHTTGTARLANYPSKTLITDTSGNVGVADTIFNIKAYGATCDGTTVDTTAIANTITAAEVIGGVVFTPAPSTGSGCVTASQTIDTHTIAGEIPIVSLVGTGNNSCWVSTTGQAQTVNLTNATNVFIHDMCFIGNSTSGWAINQNFSTCVCAFATIIERVYITGYSQVTKGAINAVGNIKLINSTVINSEYAMFYQGCCQIGPTVLFNQILFNGVGTGSSGGGIYTLNISDGTSTSEGGFIQDNVVIGNYNGVVLQSTTGHGQVFTQFLNNVVSSPNGYYDLWVRGASGTLRAFNMSGNYFAGNVQMTGSVTNFSWNDNHLEGGNTLVWNGSAGNIANFTANGNHFDGGSSGQQWTFNNVGPGIVSNTTMVGGAGAMQFANTDHLLVTNTIFSGTCSGGGGGQTTSILATGGSGCPPSTTLPSAW